MNQKKTLDPHSGLADVKQGNTDYSEIKETILDAISVVVKDKDSGDIKGEILEKNLKSENVQFEYIS